MHSSAQVGHFMTLCLGYSTESCADLMVVLVESEPPHNKWWKFSVCTFGTMISKTGKQNKRVLAGRLRSILS